MNQQFLHFKKEDLIIDACKIESVYRNAKGDVLIRTSDSLGLFTLSKYSMEEVAEALRNSRNNNYIWSTVK
jgi:hypothetical protein